MIRFGHALVVAAALLAAVACSSKSSSDAPAAQAAGAKPTGTTGDPVTVCEHIGDLCRLDASRLGVCTAPAAGPPPAACAGRKPCVLCTPQH